MREITYLQAIYEAQREEMQRDERVFIIGEDIEASFFGTTAGFIEEFGAKRVRNTPLSENGFIGAAAGAPMVGARSSAPITDIRSVPCPTNEQKLIALRDRSTALAYSPKEVQLRSRS